MFHTKTAWVILFKVIPRGFFCAKPSKDFSLTQVEAKVWPWLQMSSGASLVVQWSRIILPTQSSLVWSLVWEEPTCWWAAKPCTATIEPILYSLGKSTPEPTCLGPVLHGKRSPCSERPAHHSEEQPPLATTRKKPRQQQRPNTARVNK